MIVLALLLVINVPFVVPECNLIQDDPDNACIFPSIRVINRLGNEVNETNCGIQYKKENWQEQPDVIFPDAIPDSTYTLLLVDPDVPNYPKGQYYFHWLASNVFGSDLRTGNLSKAKILLEYMGPAPPANSGLHRYMFLVLLETVVNQKLTAPQNRTNFKLLEYLSGQDERLCGPEAGVQFLAEY